MATYLGYNRRPLTLALAMALALPLSAPAFAQDDADDDATESSTEQKLERITVTGSNIKRSTVEGPAPVTVISRDQLEKEGFVTVFDALDTLVQNNMGSNQNELNSAGGFTPNGSVVNLRGLGPGRTLLLINGRRAADYPFPYNGQSNFQNFGNIPSAAVERIEILTGGASAIYGSDAVAGVVNVVLKTNFDGDSAKLRVGTTTTGGGDFANAQWVGGRTGENWSLTYAFEYLVDEPVWAFQRDFMDSRRDNPLPPSVGPQPGSSMLIRRTTGPAAGSNFAPPAGACEAFGGELERFSTQTVSAATGAVTTLGQVCGYFKDVGYQTIANGNDDLSGYVYGTMDFDSVEAWVSMQGYDSESKLSGGVEFIGGPHIDGTGTIQTIFATNPQFNGTVLTQRIFTPQEVGGLEATYQRFYEKSLDLAFGLRGSIADRFDWDATFGRAEYRAERTRPRFDGSAVSDFFYGPRLAGTGTPRYNINLDRFYRPITPEEYRAMSTTLRYEADSYVNQANFVLSGDLFELPAGPVGFASVLEWTSQGYDLNSPEGILPTNRTVYNLTGTNGGGERDRYALGTEFRIPLLESLTATIAGRFDKYDDITAVDDAKTYGAGLEWRPLDSLLVRGQYSTSFKAPDMHFVFNEGSGGFSTNTDFFRCLSTGGTVGQSSCAGATYAYSVFATSQGEPTLKEEEGTSWSAGLVWDFWDNMSISADYYDIELEGAVTTLSTAYILEAEGGCRTGLTRNRQPYAFSADSGFCQEILSRVTRTAAPGEPTDRVTEVRSGPVNQSFRRVTGIDAAYNWQIDTDRYGNFGWELAWSHTLKSELQPFATDAVRRDYRDELTNFDFRSRMRSTIVWAKGDWTANLFWMRYGSLPNWQETGRISPYHTWNTNFGKQITENVKLSFFVNNIFNNFHPRDDGFNTYPYFWRAFSPIGREVSAQLDVTF